MKWMLMIFRIGNDVQQKGWYASKTVWFNIISLAAAIAALKGFGLDAEGVATIAAAASTIGNLWLRGVTDKPIGARTIAAPDVPPRPHPDDHPGEPPDNPFDTGTIMG